MGKKRLSAGAQIINLWADLSEAERVLVYDVIRSAQPKKAAAKGGKRSPSKAAAAPANGSDHDDQTLNS